MLPGAVDLLREVADGIVVGGEAERIFQLGDGAGTVFFGGFHHRCIIRITGFARQSGGDGVGGQGSDKDADQE